jgi:hypothetical protein
LGGSGPSIILKGLKKFKKIIFQIAGIVTEIRTENHPDTRLEHCRWINIITDL